MKYLPEGLRNGIGSLELLSCIRARRMDCVGWHGIDTPFCVA